MTLDALTKLLRQTTDVLILNSPFKTCMGTLLGIAIEGFSTLSPLIEPIPGYTWISICIFLLNMTSLLKRDRISQESKRALSIIETGRRRGLISPLEAKQRFREIIQKELDNQPKIARIDIRDPSK